MKKGLLAAVCVFLLMGAVQDSYSKNRLESWYTYWGIGYTGLSYPSELDQVLDLLKDLPGVTHTSLALDVLGFYWPKGERTILGAIVNGWSDRYDVEGSYVQINGYLYSFSMMYFLNNLIGQGLFVRGDAGFARMVVQGSGLDATSSDWGYGLLLGGGIGIPISSGTRLLIQVNYSFRKVEGETYGSMQISLGGLF